MNTLLSDENEWAHTLPYFFFTLFLVISIAPNYGTTYYKAVTSTEVKVKPEAALNGSTKTRLIHP